MPVSIFKNPFNKTIKNYFGSLKEFRAKWAITKLKKSVGWIIDKFRWNDSLVIHGTILKFVYRKINVQKRAVSNFWDFCCSYHQIIVV